MEQTVEQLYGLKLGDRVRYIGNDEVLYNKNLSNKEGEIKEIVPVTGEFRVKLDGVQYEVSFQRYELLLLADEVEEEVDFQGQVTETPKMSAAEMKSYLKTYHELKEGKDFSVTDRDGIREVMLTNEKYSLVIKDLFSVEKVSKELAEKQMRDFKHTMLPKFTPEGAVSLVFRVSNWMFRTHLTPWAIQYSVLKQYDIDLYDEWGFQNK